jgi:hypothetical protein
MQLDPISTGIRPARWRLVGEKEGHMISTDFETRQLLAREHRDQLARDMRLARRTRPETSSLQQNTRFRNSVRYRKAYGRLSSAVLTVGDAVVNQVLKLRPEV